MFAAHINASVHNERRLPLDPDGSDLFERLADGVLLWCVEQLAGARRAASHSTARTRSKLVNAAMPGTIDERVISDKADVGDKGRFAVSENIQLALSSARGIGCRLVNIGVDDVIEGRPNLMLGLLWQLVRMQLLAGVDMVHVPELVVLLEPGEALADLLKLPAERILLRWFNHHLAAAGTTQRIANLGDHVKDCSAYCALLQQLEPTCNAASAMSLPYGEARATAVLRAADAVLGSATRYVRPADIVSGNAKLNLAFVASLFNARHGLVLRAADATLLESQKELLEFGDSGEGRDERVLCYWVNSLALEAPCERLVADAADGTLLLHVLDRLSPGCVDWRRVAKSPVASPFKRLENLNLALALVRAPPFNIRIVGVEGKDLMDGRSMYVLSLFHQLMRLNLVQMLQGLTGKSGVPSDADIVALANARVAAAGKSLRMESFRDASLADGRFFLELLSAMGARVNWELVPAEQNDAAREANAKYVISVARRAGASVFCLYDDITTLKPKALLMLTVSCLALKCR